MVGVKGEPGRRNGKPTGFHGKGENKPPPQQRVGPGQKNLLKSNTKKTRGKTTKCKSSEFVKRPLVLGGG